MSIQRRILAWVLALVLIGAASTAAIVYFQARQTANALFDHQLRQIAITLPGRWYGPQTDRRDDLPDAADGVVVQIFDATGALVYISHPATVLPRQAELGFSMVTSQGSVWRVYTAWFADDVIMVAQPMAVRSKLAATVAWRTVLPLFVLLPVLLVLLFFTVRQGFTPVRRLARQVGERSAAALSPLALDGVPDEIRPVVIEINTLLGRLGRALDQQRSFVADAAHELRTPLTALAIQVQLAQRAETPDDRMTALAEVRRGLDRMVHLVGQLLTLARQEPDVHPEPDHEADLSTLCEDVVRELYPLAADRHIDLGLLGGNTGPVRVAGDPESIATMLRNLVDNAIRYSPPGSRVDVWCGLHNGHPVLRVDDEGPGIPVAEQDRVFDRFYRGQGAQSPGSGLGLSIVREVVRRHGAVLAMEPRAGAGLSFVVTFAADRAAAAATQPPAALPAASRQSLQ